MCWSLSDSRFLAAWPPPHSGSPLPRLRIARGATEVAHRAPAPATGPAILRHAARVMTGEFGTELEGGYVLLPFDVPAGTTAVRVRYCHDQPEAPTNAQIKHVLDLGLYDARRRPTGSSTRTSSAAGAARAIPT